MWDSPINKKTFAVVITIISLGCFWGILESRNAGQDAQTALRAFKQDVAERRDASCERSETEYIQKVDQLDRTFKYLDDLTPEEKGSTLNRTIVRGLPETIREARNSKPAEDCFKGKIGLDGIPPEFPIVPNFEGAFPPNKR